ncbi:MAG: ATP-dependent helicase [Thermoanaerobaculia bacterium]
MTPRVLLEGLNPEQVAAVSHERGPLLVLAGAGSGKTRVVTRRLSRLIEEGADPRTVVAVTFTNKAAEEMRERVKGLLGVSRLASFVGTFHSWGLRFLRRSGGAEGRTASFSIADSGDQASLVREAMAELSISEQMLSPGAVLGRISEAKSALVSPAQAASSADEFASEKIASIYSLYEKKLRSGNAFDFDDLIGSSVRLLETSDERRKVEQGAVSHLLIDEYQDTNGAQDALIKLIGAGAESLVAVGDEDQSIYRWRGARVEHILRFEEDFPGAKVVSLTRNYRSTSRILKAAGAIVSANRRRRPKVLVGESGEGEPVEVRTFRDDRSEADWVVSRLQERVHPLSESAILFRVNAQSRSFEDELVRRRVPYIVIGGMKFYERAEVKDAVSYYRLALDCRDDLAFRRVVNRPARGIGEATLERVTLAAREKGVSLFEASSEAAGITERARIALARFRTTVLDLGARSGDLSAASLLELVLEKSGYGELFAGSEQPEDIARRENLKELVSAAREYELREGDAASPRGFLDALALATDADAPRPEGAVSLLTLHSAKGLEFSQVFVAGLEEGFLPHSQSASSEDEVEEERRLLYVGMTRARHRLTLTLARHRLLYGEARPRFPSPFLGELPSDVPRIDEDPLPARSPSLFSRPDREDEDEPRLRRGPSITVARRKPVPGSLPGLHRGARVRHPAYGPGVILQQEGSGDDARLTVFFDRAGKKKFVAKFANLTPA